jgi:hypothetical protein
MYECDNIYYVDYLNVIVASRIMSSLADWALLFVFVYVLNSMLLKQLGISSSGSKTVLLIVIGVMFAVTVADMSLDSYVTLTDDFLGGELALAAFASQGLSLTLEVLWMISVIISAAVSLSNISTLRSRSLPGGVSSRRARLIETFPNKFAGPGRLGHGPLRFLVCPCRIERCRLFELLLARDTSERSISGDSVHFILKHSLRLHNTAGYRQTHIVESDYREDRAGILCACHATTGDIRLWQRSTGLLPADT